MKRSTWMKGGVILVIALFMAVFVLELDAYARVGGSRSFGSRGSRSSYSPSSPSASQPASPSRNLTSPAPAAPQAQRGGFLRTLGAGMAGGLLGGMLFSSLGFGGQGGMGGGGIGLFEIILLGGLLYGIYWFIKRRKQNAAATTASPAYYQASGPKPVSPGYAQPSYATPQDAVEDDRRQGIGYIKQMDPNFNEDKFNDLCMDIFFKIQGAWANRDMSPSRSLMTDEMYRIMQDDAERMKREGKFNKLENIAVRTVEISEAWQEQGKDFITVRFLANLLDYTVSESGELLSGSKTDPVKFEEYWTVVRPVGNNPWQLSGINQTE
ncbi:MAG: Tim44 domain-containing protein [Syntrophales bacterium]|nr:Tim44 domain-containing protein [Syntrophales bacterium]MCK9390727.1 Tim44 domain-containing protein [Syntrophales bacterium]